YCSGNSAATPAAQQHDEYVNPSLTVNGEKYEKTASAWFYLAGNNGGNCDLGSFGQSGSPESDGK
ncbi:hypothetical protein ACNGV6_004671, partial [Escherichia coli]